MSSAGAGCGRASRPGRAPVEPFPSEPAPLVRQLADAAPIWQAIATKHHLAETDFHRLSSAWHTDADLGRPIEVVTDMSKSRKLGFRDYQATDDSCFDLFSQLREKRIIPPMT